MAPASEWRGRRSLAINQRFNLVQERTDYFRYVHGRVSSPYSHSSRVHSIAKKDHSDAVAPLLTCFSSAAALLCHYARFNSALVLVYSIVPILQFSLPSLTARSHAATLRRLNSETLQCERCKQPFPSVLDKATSQPARASD